MNITREEKNELINEITNRKRVWLMGGRREHVRFVVEQACTTAETLNALGGHLGPQRRRELGSGLREQWKAEGKRNKRFGNPLLFMVLFTFIWYFVEKWLDERFD